MRMKSLSWRTKVFARWSNRAMIPARCANAATPSSHCCVNCDFEFIPLRRQDRGSSRVRAVPAPLFDLDPSSDDGVEDFNLVQGDPS